MLVVAQGILGWHYTLRYIARKALPTADRAKIRDQTLRAGALIGLCLAAGLLAGVVQGVTVLAALNIEALMWVLFLVAAFVQQRLRRPR